MIKGKKVVLRALEKEDIENCWRWINDPEITEGLAMIFPVSKYEEEKWYENTVGDDKNKIFAIEADSTYIGNIGLHEIDWVNRKAELGIMIGEKESQGKGYGTDAIKTLLRYAFTKMNLHKIQLRAFEYNKKAIQCYKKCGFNEEGVMREDVFRNGTYHSTIFMSILRSEFIEDEKV
ncbi:MAG: GNAT family protein [Euryarchaeota archaeon]|nr:GNAT family protein [Euryarchaeota archaeon]